MAYLLVIILAAVLYQYGSSVFRTTGHALKELIGFLTLLIGLLVIGTLLILLTNYSDS